MSLTILDSCINCDVCEPVCPNEAISFREPHYQIDPKLCTECKGHFDEPQCIVYCPVECIVPLAQLAPKSPPKSPPENNDTGIEKDP